MENAEVRIEEPKRGAAVVLVLLVPAVLYATIAVGWELRQRSPVTGDEPHYLVVADALLHDHSLSLSRAYARNARQQNALGPTDWLVHSYPGPRGVFGIHGIGLPALIAFPFAAGGIPAVRLMLAAFAGLIPWLFFAIARLRGISRWPATSLAVAASLGLPYLVAAGQVFPDLPSGVLILAATYFVLAASQRQMALPSAVTAGLVLAVLPWIHIKNTVATIVAAVAIVILQRRLARRNVRGASRTSVFVMPLICALLGLAGYNFYAFGRLAGPYIDLHAAGGTVRQALMIFLGLHLDQSQGMFVQQPLLLLGVIGLPFLIQRCPISAAAIALMYLGIVLPNSFHQCWYGCQSLPGRFMWSVAALWFVPIVFLYAALERRGRLAMVVAAGASVAWQVSSLAHWCWPGPSHLYTVFQPDLLDRDGVFPIALRHLLPSFYDFDGYLAYAPNLAAIALVASIATVGLLRILRQRTASRRVFTARVASLVLRCSVAALLLFAVATVATRASAGAEIVDLVALLPRARVSPSSGAAKPIVSELHAIAGETRLSVVACAPSRIIWHLRIPAEARLHTFVGVDSTGAQGASDGVRFRVRISGAAGYDELMSRQLEPTVIRDDRRWVPVSFDLRRYAGREVDIVFNTYGPEGAPTGQPHAAYWAEPVLHRQ